MPNNSRRMNGWYRVTARTYTSLVLFILAACASVPPPMPPIMLQWTSPEKRVVLVQPVFDLSERSANGTLSTRSDWSDAAQIMTARQVTDIAETKGLRLVSGEPSANLPRVPKCIEYEFYYPSTIDHLRADYGADYALCIHVSDWYSTAGRQAAQAAEGAGVAILILPFCAAGGCGGLFRKGLSDDVPVCRADECARAALVDLRTGKSVWQQTIGSRDWRNDPSVKRAVSELLKDAPF
jgi:hypothetical protein